MSNLHPMSTNQLSVRISCKSPDSLSAGEVTVTGNMQHRFCLALPRSEIRSYTCQDAGPYRDVIERIIKNITDGSPLVDLKSFDFSGDICLCNTNNCNLNLPPLTVYTGTAITPTAGTQPPPGNQFQSFIPISLNYMIVTSLHSCLLRRIGVL